jgi:hypothetical protein
LQIDKLVNESDVICMMHASYTDNPKWSLSFLEKGVATPASASIDAYGCFINKWSLSSDKH